MSIEDTINKELTEMVLNMAEKSEITVGEPNSLGQIVLRLSFEDTSDVLYVWKGDFTTNFKTLDGMDITYIVNDNHKLYETLLSKTINKEEDLLIDSKLEEISKLCKEVYNLRLVKALNKTNRDKDDLEIIKHYMDNNPIGE